MFFDLPLGSQADWVQAVASILASIGLTVTLLLQRKTANDQKELLRIEMEKDRRTVMPYFIIVDSSITSEIDTYEWKVKMKLENARAFNVVCKAEGNASVRLIPTFPVF